MSSEPRPTPLVRLVGGAWLLGVIATLVACDPAEASCEATGPEVMAARCVSCHSAERSGPSRDAPEGLNFDTDGDVQRQIPQIRQALAAGSMPPGIPLGACEQQALDDWLTQLAGRACEPGCSGRRCGDDGCGGSCGAPCADGLTCTPEGQCAESVCLPSCEGAVCGDDGCGSSCGTCPEGEGCVAGACVCVPDCDDRQCGPDGCGGFCGGCAAELFCRTLDGQCVESCERECDGRVCGDDGCGGSCGGECPEGTACSGAGQCVCAPSCGENVCGDDGCGGSCGSCASVQDCVEGRCVWPARSYATDIHPLFQGCGTSSCHGGAKPAQGLNLSNSSTAYAALVDVPSTQCSGRLQVKPGDPGASYLVAKLTGVGMCAGSIMPKTGAKLSAAQIDEVRAWIGSGAAP